MMLVGKGYYLLYVKTQKTRIDIDHHKIGSVKKSNKTKGMKQPHLNLKNGILHYDPVQITLLDNSAHWYEDEFFFLICSIIIAASTTRSGYIQGDRVLFTFGIITVVCAVGFLIFALLRRSKIKEIKDSNLRLTEIKRITISKDKFGIFFSGRILRSSYSQRFYEFCCRFRDTGNWHVSVEELRTMLRIDEKYATYGELKRKVLDVAQKELQELYNSNESDVCFVYDELKTKRAVTHLHIRIKAKEKNKGVEESTAEDLQLIHQYLKSFWPNENQESRRTQVFNELNKKKAFKEFKIKADDICARYQDKRAHDLAGILTIAMKEDLGVLI
jgi:hypothetical protein